MSDDTIRNAVRDTLAQRAYGSIYSSAYADAQKSAQANELATRLGMPSDVVAADYPNMVAEDRLRRRTEEIRQNQAYARIMANSPFADAAIDDDHLPSVAQKTDDHVTQLGWGSGFRSYAKSLLSGATALSSGLYGLGRATAENLANSPDAGASRYVLNPIANWFKSAQEQTNATTNSLMEKTDSRLFNYVLQGNQSVLPSVGSMAATVLTKNPAIGGLLMGGMTAGQSYGQARDAKLSPLQSLSYAGQQGAFETMMEMVSGRVFGHSVAEHMGLGKTIARQMGTELATEIPTTILQDTSTYANIGINQGQSFSDFVKTLPEDALATAVGTVATVGLMTGTSMGVTHVAQKVIDRAVDKRALNGVNQIMAAAAQSPTRDANPSGFRDAVHSLVADSTAENLYVPAEQVRALFQSDDSGIADDPFWSRYEAQVNEADALGGDVVIPLADAATHLAGSPQWNALKDHVRTRPGGSSLSELKTKQSPEELQQLADAMGQTIDQAHQNVQLGRARVEVGKWAESLGYAGDQAKAVNRLLSSALVTRYQGEAAKATAAGEQTPTLQEFARSWLPEAQKTSQAAAQEFAYSEKRTRTVAREAKKAPTEAAFDPTPHLSGLRDYVTKTKKSLKPEAVAKHFGISNTQAGTLLSAFASSRDAPVTATANGLQRKAAGPNDQMDVMTFVTRAGGLKDDEGHNLSKGRDFNKRPGLINKRGNSIDQIGERLWEAGFFGHGSERPTTADVLDLLDRANFDKVYAPHVAADRQAQDQQDSRDAEEEWYREGLREEAKRLNLDLTPELETRALDFVARGFSDEDAVLAAMVGVSRDALDGVDEDGHKGYDYGRAADDLTEGLDEASRGSAGGSSFGADPFDPTTWGSDDGADPYSGPLFQVLNQLFDEPNQPQRSMTQAQRAELEARQQQSMARRGGQESVKDQAGGLFSSERDQQTLLQEQQQRARGSIQITPDAQGLMASALIRSYEAANFSTAVHELGHFFLEDLRRRAVRGRATEQEMADWQTFRDWAAEQGHPVGDIGPIPTEAHEFFARGMERFVFEGQAPAKGLKALFFRMREFMLDLYRTASAFNAPITPEIREVMGRMLASDSEVAAQAEEMKLASAAVGDLLSEAERTEYEGLANEARNDARDKLYERVLSALRAEKAADFRDRKAEIKASVTDQVDAQPQFRALSMLRGGIPQEDGTRSKVRLARQWLVDNYGEDAVDRLPKSVPPIIGDTDLIDADQIAGLSGFDNGDQMVRALFALEEERQAAKASGDKRSSRQRQIEDETDRRARDEIGDPFADLEEEAQAALASDRQADLMSMELRALARKTGKKPTAWALAKQWATDKVQGETSRDALSGRAIQQHARNASKAAGLAEEALVKGDFEAAFKAKQQQMLNMALLSEAKKAKDEVDKGVRRLRNIATRDTIRSVDQDYLDQAHQLLEDVDLRERSTTAVDKRMAFEDWYLAEVAAGREPVVPASYRSVLGKTHWSQLPVSELLELDKAVGQMVQLGRLKQKLRDGKNERDFNEAVAELEATALAGQSRKRTRDNDPNRTMLSRAKSRLRAIDAAMLKVEQLTTWLDGGKANGPWGRMVFGPMAEAQGREDDLKRTYVKEINDLIKSVPKPVLKSWERLVDTPELTIKVAGHPNVGEPWQFTKDQIVMMAMNWGNEGNRQRLLDGFGFNENDVQTVFERLLTKQDWDFVQGVWDTVDGLWPEIEALERRVNGVAPEKVEAAEVLTSHGSYRGGYFPAIYDPTYSTRTELDDASKLSPNGAWFDATTRASSTKQRAVAVKGRPLLLSMSVITRHLGEVIHDVTHREAVVQVRKLLKNAQVRNAINDQLGPEYAKAMDGWLENIAQPNIADSKMNPTLVALARHLNKGVSMVGLGFRLSTVLLQPIGMANTAKEIGTARVAQGMATFVAHPVETYREVTRRSAEMRARFTTMDSSIEDMTAMAAGNKLKLIGPQGIAKYAFHGILYADMLVTISGWTGAFNKGLAEGMNEEDAGHYADSVIRSTQGAGGQKDRSSILYENSFAKTFWPFFSYLNALYNQQRDVGHKARRIGNVGDLANVAREAWWVAIVPPLVQALLMGTGPDDDRDDPEAWARYLARNVMLGNLSSIPLIGALGNAIGSGYGYRSNAWQSVGESITKGVKSLHDNAGNGELPKGATVKSVINILGVLSAKPLGQPAATAGGLYDYARGEADPHGAGEWYDLLTTGKVHRPKAPEPVSTEGEQQAA